MFVLVRKMKHEIYGELYYLAIIDDETIYTNAEIDELIDRSYEKIAYEHGAFVDRHDDLREIYFRTSRCAEKVKKIIEQKLEG